MSVLLVTYDLKNRGDAYYELLKLIKSYEWARLSDSSYAIETDETPCEVYTSLRHVVDTNDNLYVTVMNRPYYGFGPDEVNQWLSERLPKPHGRALRSERPTVSVVDNGRPD